MFPPLADSSYQFHFSLDATLALYIHNRPWKHQGNTDTLGLSIMRTHGSPGLKAFFQSSPPARTCLLTAERWCCTSQHSLSVSPKDKICPVPLQVMQWCHLKMWREGKQALPKGCLRTVRPLAAVYCSCWWIWYCCNKQLVLFLQYVLVYLLPQSKAFQPDSGSPGSQNRRGKMHFNFRLIFTHDTCKG